jgi:hypothetical protein
MRNLKVTCFALLTVSFLTHFSFYREEWPEATSRVWVAGEAKSLF